MAATATNVTLLTLGEAAERLTLSARTVRRKAATGEIRAVKLGNGPTCRVRIPEDAVTEYLDIHTIGRAGVDEKVVTSSADRQETKVNSCAGRRPNP